MTVPVTVSIQHADFDLAEEVAALTNCRADVGAVVTFIGICRRDEDSKGATALTIEHYSGMAEAEIGRHVEEAMSLWPLTGLTIIHRIGRVEVGENIVVVLTASAHRQGAFQAAEFLMDFLKTRAPFWKREETSNGANWVDAQSQDGAAAARWANRCADIHELSYNRERADLRVVGRTNT